MNYISKHNLLKNVPAMVMILISLSFLLTGCGHAPKVTTALLQNEAGDFQYADVSWGMDKASVEAALGITFDRGTINPTPDTQMYIATDTCTLMGYPATVFCEFDASGLYSIRFRIAPADKDVQACWDTLTEELLTQYGSVEPYSLSFDSPVKMVNETYRWEHSDTIHTALTAMQTSLDRQTPTIDFRVYVIPEDHIQ